MFQYNQNKMFQKCSDLFTYSFLILLPNNIHATFVERFMFPIKKHFFFKPV